MSITTSFFFGKYQRVEYITSDRYQRIDTGYKGNQNTAFETKTRMTGTNTQNQQRPGGDMGNTNTNSITIVFRTPGSSDPVNNRFGGTVAQLYSSDTPIGTDIVVNISKNGFIINNVSKSRSGSVGTFTTENNMELFRVYNKRDVDEGFIGRMYYAKIRDNGTLIRDFVPAYRKSDNVIGMVEKVSKTFYTNKGSGTFGKGSDIPR